MTRHRFDTFSALAGMLSLAVAIGVGARTGPVGLAELQLLGPVAILILGVALVAGAGRSQAERDQDPADEQPGHGGEAESHHG